MSFTSFTGSVPPFGNIVQPGAYSYINAGALSAPANLPTVPIPAVIGTSLGGAPSTPMWFGSAGTAHSVLRGGPGHDCVQHAFAGGASIVAFVRVGNSITQGSISLAGSAGTIATLTSLDYGSWNNSILITVATGPIITLQYTNPLGVTSTETWNLTPGQGTAPGTTTNAVVAAAINGTLYGYQASNFVSATAGAGTLPLTNISTQPLTGGTDGSAPAAGDWTIGLTALEPQIVDFIVPATSTASVHSQCLTHVLHMSQPAARRERVLVYGGALGETVAQQVSRVTALGNNSRAQQVYPGIQDYNSAGVLTTYDSFYSAARVAGLHCAQPDTATPLTHKQIPAVGLETNLSTAIGSSIDQLLNAGVTPLAPAPVSGYWVVDSLSTYNTDLTFRDMHKIRSADTVARTVRAKLEASFVGGKNLNSTQEAIGVVADAELDNLVTSEIIRQHQPTIVTQGANQNTFLVDLPVMLVDTTKYILLQIALQPSSVLNTATQPNT